MSRRCAVSFAAVEPLWCLTGVSAGRRFARPRLFRGPDISGCGPFFNVFSTILVFLLPVFPVSISAMPSFPSLKEATAMLAGLVACPSVNPRGKPPSDQTEGEARLAALMAETLRAWGASVEISEVSPGRPNLVARWKGRNSARTLMFEAHSDTVPVDGMTVPPFQPEVREGRLFGRGSCDTKGSMAAMLLAIRAVTGSGPPPVDLVFASTCDEEMGATGARRLMDSGLRPDAAVVGEPTDLDIVNAHKGTVRVRIITRGVAAHSSAPERGVNAISHMRRVLDVIDEKIAPDLARRAPHPRLGRPTVSVGVIRGGSQVNVVPSHCRIEVDRRTLPSESREEVIAAYKRELDALGAEDGRFECDLEETQFYPPFEEPEDSAVSRLVAASCRTVLGKADFTGAPWSANAGVFKAAGVPCVLFGPGSAREAHTKDEYVEMEQVLKASGVYGEIIRNF
jgi:acetylornithine deacetylase/succinyl-diaminopimelate desuccinylase family protein